MILNYPHFLHGITYIHEDLTNFTNILTIVLSQVVHIIMRSLLTVFNVGFQNGDWGLEVFGEGNMGKHSCYSQV